MCLTSTVCSGRCSREDDEKGTGDTDADGVPKEARERIDALMKVLNRIRFWEDNPEAKKVGARRSRAGQGRAERKSSLRLVSHTGGRQEVFEVLVEVLAERR